MTWNVTNVFSWGFGGVCGDSVACTTKMVNQCEIKCPIDIFQELINRNRVISQTERTVWPVYFIWIDSIQRHFFHVFGWMWRNTIPKESVHLRKSHPPHKHKHTHTHIYIYTYECEHAHQQKWVWLAVDHHHVWSTLSNILPIGTRWTISFWKVILQYILATITPIVSTIMRYIHSNRTAHSTGTTWPAGCVVRAQSWRSKGKTVTRWAQYESWLQSMF